MRNVERRKGRGGAKVGQLETAARVAYLSVEFIAHGNRCHCLVRCHRSLRHMVNETLQCRSQFIKCGVADHWRVKGARSMEGQGDFL